MYVGYGNQNLIRASLSKFRCSGCLNDCSRFVMRRREYFVARCARCGLAHFLPRPEVEQDSHQLHDLDYYEGVMKRLRPGLHYHSTKLLRMLSLYSPPPGRLMEVGCATGLFLTDAHAAGYTVTGIE